MPANTTSILQPMNQGGIQTFRFYYLRNIFLEAKAVKDSDSYDDLSKENGKSSGSYLPFQIPDATKNIHGSWEQIKVSAFTGVWKKSIATLLDAIEELKTSVEEVTTNMVEITRELELEIELQDGEWIATIS